MEYVDVMIDALSETVHVRFGQATTMVSLRVRICACSGGWGAGGGLGSQGAHLGDRTQISLLPT